MNNVLLLRKKIRRLIEDPGAKYVVVENRSSVLRAHATGTSITGIAVIVGVGDGLGTSLVKCLSEAGMVVAALARDKEHLSTLMRNKGWSADNVKLYACDATNEVSFNNTLECVSLDLGVPNLVVYLVQDSMSRFSLDIEPTALEDTWRANCLGAFIVARKTAKLMTSRGSGTIIFVGATSAIIGRPGYLSLAVGKFALRALSQVMARELWPQGIHVVHVIIDGGTFYFGRQGEEFAGTDPEAVAKTLLFLHTQPKNSWTHELDLRPWNERFWKHC